MGLIVGTEERESEREVEMYVESVLVKLVNLNFSVKILHFGCAYLKSIIEKDYIIVGLKSSNWIIRF